MLIAQPPLKQAVVDHGLAPHWHEVKARDDKLDVTLDQIQQSALAIDGTIC